MSNGDSNENPKNLNNVHRLPSLIEAEREVQESTEKLELALDHLKDKVDFSIYSAQRFLEASKNPAVVIGITFVVGVFFGQMIRLSYSRSK